jgi:prophage antirepressor-like protein
MSENKIQVWNYESSEIRTVQINGEPWFVLSDVCKVLEIKNSRDAAAKLDGDEKGVALTDTLGGKQQMTIINESGLYTVILRSDKPQAKPFRKWVTSEVLPSIRKHGAYMTPETIKKVMLTPDFIISLAGELKNEQEKNKKLTLELESKDEEIGTLKPKATYCDLVLSCTNAVPISLIAKDYGMSARKLNSILNDMKIQYKCGGQWILNQNYAGKGYTKSATHTYNTIYGTAANIRTNWTQKGRLLIYEKLKEQGILPLMEQ